MKWPDFNREGLIWFRVDHVTHGLQNDRSKSSGILRSLYSLLFCYYSLLVFVKIARFGYRHYYKSFVTVCTYKLVPSALSALRLCGTRELRHPNDSTKQNLGLFSLSFFSLCSRLLRHFSIAASNSQRLSFMSDGHEVSLTKGLRETSLPFQSFTVKNWPSS